MAINPEIQYPGKIDPSSLAYPYGQARNITVPGDGTGTPWEAAIVNDNLGFQQALLMEAGIVPTGTPDEVGASQYLSSVKKLRLFFTDIAELQASTIDFKVGEFAQIASPNCLVEVITADGTGFALDNGTEARGIKQRLQFDNVAAMKAEPSGLFVAGTRINIQNYYAGWAVVITSIPYSFDGIIASDATVLNVRGAAADNIGDHVLGTDLNFLADVKQGFNSRVWGVKPNEAVDAVPSLQAMFNAPRVNSSPEFILTGGAHLVDTAELEIKNFGKVTITGDDSWLELGTGDVAKFALRIKDCVRVKWLGLDCDLGKSIYNGAVRIQNIRRQVKIRDADFYNFNNVDSGGFECAQQTGFDLDTINKNPVNISNNSSPGLQVVNCSFGNETTILDTSFDYDSNELGGTGIRLNNDVEYWHVTNCGFFGQCIGMWIESGNGSIVNCEFQEILGVDLKSRVGAGIPEGGAVYLPSAGDNNGKLNITGCKFNHNWGFGIRSAYSSANRPISVTNCQFIANSFTAINITGTAQSIITGNYFQRAHNFLALASWPWAAFNGGRVTFIQLASGATSCTVKDNRGDDLPLGTLVENISGGVTQNISNNTVSSTVTDPTNVFFTATPIINHDNYVMG